MKKHDFILRLVSLFLVSLCLMPSVFATGKKDETYSGKTSDYSAEAIGIVPKEYKGLVDGNIALGNNQITEDFWVSTEDKDGKITVKKYGLAGEKLWETSYKQRGAGTQKPRLFTFKLFHDFVRCSESSGNVYSWSRLYRFIGFIGFSAITGNKLVKISPDGDVLWKKDFGFNKMIYDVTEKENGEIIVNVAKPAKLFSGTSNANYKCYLILLSADGEIKNEISLEKDVFNVKIQGLTKDGFFAEVTEYKQEEYTDYLCAFDHEFNLLWKQEKETNSINNIYEDFGEEGYPLVTKINDDSSGKYRSTCISRIGFDKKVLATHEWKSNSLDEYVSCEYILSNGDYVFEFSESKTGKSIDKKYRFVRYSSDFECLGEIELTGYGINRIIETDDCIIFCMWNAKNYDENGGVQDREIVYTAFDYDYNLLWQKAVSE